MVADRTLARKLLRSMAIRLATVLAQSCSSDNLAKQSSLVQVASFNVFNFGGVERRYTHLRAAFGKRNGQISI